MRISIALVMQFEVPLRLGEPCSPHLYPPMYESRESKDLAPLSPGMSQDTSLMILTRVGRYRIDADRLMRAVVVLSPEDQERLSSSATSSSTNNTSSQNNNNKTTSFWRKSSNNDDQQQNGEQNEGGGGGSHHTSSNYEIEEGLTLNLKIPSLEKIHEVIQKHENALKDLL